MLLNYKCDISQTKATVSASFTKFNSNYVSKRTAYSSFVVTGITSVKLPVSTICFIKIIASYFIHFIVCQITRYFFCWPLCCLFFFDYGFWLLLWYPQNLLIYKMFFYFILCIPCAIKALSNKAATLRCWRHPCIHSTIGNTMCLPLKTYLFLKWRWIFFFFV